MFAISNIMLDITNISHLSLSVSQVTGFSAPSNHAIDRRIVQLSIDFKKKAN